MSIAVPLADIPAQSSSSGLAVGVLVGLLLIGVVVAVVVVLLARRRR